MSKKRRLYVDFHVVQTVPPSCVNRDDTGSPKIAVYGGVTRARVSSQSWKHAIRVMFIDLLEKEDIGYRTKHVKSLIAEQIALLDPNADAEKLAVSLMKVAKLTVDNKKGTTRALFFISAFQVRALAELAVSGESIDEKNVKKAMKEFPSVDIALFGRMVADDHSLNYDAASQVAHAISTHAVHNEYDYFTALDDCSEEDNAGAAHLNTIEYNSATLYRYATVNITELISTIGDKTYEALMAFAEAFICSMPTGKQNTFANRTLPDLVYITVRKDQPVNLVGAFEKPIGGNEGYAKPSIDALAKHAKEVYDDYACEPAAVLCCGKNAELFGEKKNLPAILEELPILVKKMLEE